jgi:hypothetical protein
MRSRRSSWLRVAALLMLALLIAAVATWLFADAAGDEQSLRPAPRARPEPAEPGQARPAPSAAAPPRELTHVRTNTPPRIISAALDRSRLCPGESTLLRVTAEDAEDTDLRYQAKFLDPQRGTPLFGFGRWLRYEAASQPGQYAIVSFVQDPEGGRDSVSLSVVVEDCPQQTGFDAGLLRIEHRELDAQVHAFDLRRAERGAREAGKVLKVLSWNLGDGTSAGPELALRHHYPVVLSRRYSYYLVQAEISLDGVPRRLEYGLTFYSYAAANLKSGYVALAADVERGDDTRPAIEYVVTFSNLTPFLAEAREFDVICLDAAGLPRDRWQEPLHLTVPGESSLEQSLQLDRERCPGGATYELFGEAEAGHKTGGLWSYKLRPSTGPAADAAARNRARAVLTRERG